MIRRLINYYRRNFKPAEEYARYIGVKIGNGCSIATKSFGTEPYLIEIGDDVQITVGVKFFTHGAGWVFRKKTPGFDFFGKIVIKNNVYIGNGVMILPGITIGNNVIVGAGSVVTKSIPDNAIVGGNPARIIGDTNEFEKRISPFNLNTKKMDSESKRTLLLSLADDKFLKK